ncbi:endonuclease/exonuclease/phosphatase family protein [Streptomyces sp. NBC_01178]|uniref:endonuclease/exonuclease/phosphatase family protein n=1 Tax=Streptomyces sp. NBC_01178 TaxID=2903762 RepID=UPI00386E8F5C|nr:endonuclease/exonuclease/phosphatase family protein [Streptomyces sp. NBC_01178]
MRRDTGGRTAGRPGRPARYAARPLLVLAAALLALLPASAPVPVPEPRTAPDRLRIATWNMCGVEQWNCGGTGEADRKVRALTELVTEDGADVVLLQEVCDRDLADARQALGPGWDTAFRGYAHRSADGRFAPVGCGAHRGRAGIAVLASAPLSRVGTVDAQQPEVGLHRGALCATVFEPGVRVCGAHLSLPGSDRAHPRWELGDDQLAALVDAAGDRTVFGGDLNSTPPTASNARAWIWPDGAFGRYRECDQQGPDGRTGRPTLASGGKIDYLFTDLPRSGCSVRDTSASDHLVLIMEVETGRGSGVQP